MRKGEILEENSPKTLMSKYDSENLDKVFWKICYDHKDKRKSIARVSPNSTLKSETDGTKCYQI
ncbi:hypothetical protein B4U80_05137 [Leptotrombidium deliense]|uniref:Uncharacterized protein n=1 Tax=Leptotrombidium deliense TaxID=299467 RepID=A0A443RRU3_9ACAR|nr:hypothetical protein B4U80_05137 [Leptotrombidium deliense]